MAFSNVHLSSLHLQAAIVDLSLYIDRSFHSHFIDCGLLNLNIFKFLLPAFQQVIQDQAYLGQGSKAKPTYSSVDPHAHWQHNQVSLLSYDVTRMEEFPSVATKFINVMVTTNSLFQAGTPSAVTGAAPSSTSKRWNILLLKQSCIVLTVQCCASKRDLTVPKIKIIVH